MCFMVNSFAVSHFLGFFFRTFTSSIIFLISIFSRVPMSRKPWLLGWKVISITPAQDGGAWRVAGLPVIWLPWNRKRSPPPGCGLPKEDKGVWRKQIELWTKLASCNPSPACMTWKKMPSVWMRPSRTEERRPAMVHFRNFALHVQEWFYLPICWSKEQFCIVFFPHSVGIPTQTVLPGCKTPQSWINTPRETSTLHRQKKQPAGPGLGYLFELLGRECSLVSSRGSAFVDSTFNLKAMRLLSYLSMANTILAREPRRATSAVKWFLPP